MYIIGAEIASDNPGSRHTFVAGSAVSVKYSRSDGRDAVLGTFSVSKQDPAGAISEDKAPRHAVSCDEEGE